MKLLDIKKLSGRNIYCHRPVLEITIDLENLTGKETNEYPLLEEKVTAMLPGLKQHFCGLGYPGGFIKRLREGTYFGHLFEHLVIELQQEAGINCRYGKTRVIKPPNIYRVIVEYRFYEPAVKCLELALSIIEFLVGYSERPAENFLEELRRLTAKYRLGPSTQSIWDAACKRGIPVSRFKEPYSILQLGTGCFQRRLQATITDRTSSIAVDIACDKALTKEILARAGIPTPPGELVQNKQQAVQTAAGMGFPVVVKPGDGNQGKGVSLNLTGQAEISKAFDFAASFSNQIIVEKFVCGKNYRLTIVDGEMCAAAERIPAMVIGDGINTISELAEELNLDPRRGYGHEKQLTKLNIDEAVKTVLSRQGYNLEMVPAEGEEIYLRENANLSSGGTAIDVTDSVNPVNKELAVKAAETIGLDIAGVDIVTPDISLPLTETGGAVIEVNAAPGIRMHHFPQLGQSRDVAGRIVEMVFPSGSKSAVPIFSVTGTNGKTTTCRLISRMMTEAGFQVGLTTTDGTYIGNRLIESGDNSGPDSARMILMNKKVEAAVFETARGGIIRAGLGYDLTDIAVVTNISPDHFGTDGLETIEDLVYVKSLVAEAVKPGGKVVLNAGDHNVVKMASRVPQGVKIVYFGLEQDNIIIRRHISEGGEAVFLNNNKIVLVRNNVPTPLISLEQVPLTMGGKAVFNIENALAATAAAAGFLIDTKAVINVLEKFAPDAVDNPGRCNSYNLGAISLILDYGHNPAGIEQMIAWGRKMTTKRLWLVLGVPGDRSDGLIRETGRRAAKADMVIIREDLDRRGRNPGVTASLLRQGLLGAGMPASGIIEVLDETEALETAVRNAHAGDMIIHFYEKLAPVQAQADKLSKLNKLAAVPETISSGA